MPFYTLLHTVEAFATAARSIYSSDIPTFEPHMRNSPPPHSSARMQHEKQT